jgi:uncharacterized protein
MKPCRGTVGILVIGLWLMGGMLFSPPAFAAAKKYLSLGTGNPGGTYYFIGAGFSRLMNKYVPEVRVIAESTAASEENINLVLRKKMDLGMAGIHALPALIERKTDVSGMRLLGIGHSSDTHWIIRKESPVKGLADFRGRKVAVGAPGSGALIGARDSLKILAGLTFDDFKPVYLTFTESITGLRDQTIDVGYVQAGYPVASIMDLAQHHPIRLISYSNEEINRLVGQRPFYVKIIIPGGTYKGVETDIVTHGSVAMLFCRQDLSEELVYKLMQAVYDHPKERDVIHPQAKQWSLEYIFRAAGYTTQHVPFHAGAVKYLKEKGVWKEKF